MPNILLTTFADKNNCEIKISIAITGASQRTAIDLAIKTFQHEYLENPDIAYNQIYYDNVNRFCIIAEHNNEIIACCSLFVDKSKPSNICWFYGGLVIPEYQGRGIYQVLFETRLEYVKNIFNCKLTRLDSTNKIVQKLAEKYGFQRNGDNITYSSHTNQIIKKPLYYKII